MKMGCENSKGIHKGTNIMLTRNSYLLRYIPHILKSFAPYAYEISVSNDPLKFTTMDKSKIPTESVASPNAAKYTESDK